MKKILILFILIFSVFTLVGCVEKYDGLSNISRGFFKPKRISIIGDLHSQLGKPFIHENQDTVIIGFYVEFKTEDTRYFLHEYNTLKVEVFSPNKIKFIQVNEITNKAVIKTLDGEITKFRFILDNTKVVEIYPIEKN